MDDKRFDAVTKALAGGASRRTALRALFGGSLATLLVGHRIAPAAADCRANTQKCDLPTECCSGRCRSGRCRQGRLRAGSACTHDQQCRSGICGRINAQSSICRSAGCVRAARRCTLSTDCCRGVCDAGTLECVD